MQVMAKFSKVCYEKLKAFKTGLALQFQNKMTGKTVSAYAILNFTINVRIVKLQTACIKKDTTYLVKRRQQTILHTVQVLAAQQVSLL